MIIDISNNQGNIDWAVLKSSNPELEGVYIKASEGVGFVDPRCVQNAIEADKVKLPIGYYHFATLNNANNVEKDAKDEANYFSFVIKNLPKPTLPLVLDVETNKVGLKKAQVEIWIKAFLQEMDTLGYKNMSLYSYSPFLDTNLPPNHSLGSIPLWIANYSAKSDPKLPKGWTKAWLWQFSCTGNVSGISGRVDLNKKLQK